MDRATKAIKRSSIRFKPHSDLNMIISDLNDIRTAEKTSIRAYQIFIEDLVKWANQDSNEAIKYLFSLVSELHVLWTGIHNEFLEHLKNFKYQFDMILENEQIVDKARDNLMNSEQHKIKLNKDLKKLRKKLQSDNLDSFEEKVINSERAVDLARKEVAEKVNENEVIKLIRLKSGLMKLIEAQSALVQKCDIILTAQKDVVSEIPDPLGGIPIHEMRYSENGKAKYALIQAREGIQHYNNMTMYSPKAKFLALEYEAPPPYSPFSNDDAASCSAPSYSVPPYISHRDSLSSTSQCSELFENTNNGTTSSFRMCHGPTPSTSYDTSTPKIHNYGTGASTSLENNPFDTSECSSTSLVYICCKCSSKMISKHMYKRLKERCNPTSQLSDGISRMSFH